MGPNDPTSLLDYRQPAPPSESIVPAVSSGDGMSSDAGGSPSGSISAWDSSGKPIKRSGSLYTGSLSTGGGGEVGHWKAPAASALAGSAMSGRQVNPTDDAFVAPVAGETSYGSAMGTAADLQGRIRTRQMLDAAFGTDASLAGPDYSGQMTQAYKGDQAMNAAKLGALQSEVEPTGTQLTPDIPGTDGQPGTPGMRTVIPMSRQQIMAQVSALAKNPNHIVQPFLMRLAQLQGKISSYNQLARGIQPDGSIKKVDPDQRDAYLQYASELEKEHERTLQAGHLAAANFAQKNLFGNTGALDRSAGSTDQGFPGAPGH